MNVLEFTYANEDTQHFILDNYGVLVAERILGETRVFLYQVAAFYIEVFNEQQEADSCLRIVRVFTSTRHLDPYLAMVNIDNCLPWAGNASP